MTETVYLDTHTLVVGASGAGKTVTAKDQVEQMLGAGRHVCIVDPTGVWHGLRAAADGEGPGFPIPIFGGPHGDVAITFDQGGKIGDIIGAGVSAIVDLSAMDSDEQQDFVHWMIAALRKKPRGNFHLVVDEADEFAPQTSPSKAGEAAKRQMEWIAKRGRVQGFVLTAITQRPADIAKSVISQMQTVIAHQLISPADQDAVRAYLKANADKATIAAVMESLAGLKRGERWIYSPRLGILERGISPVPRTFDSSRTPEPGEHPIEPKMLAEIDLGEMKRQLAPPNAPREQAKAPSEGENASSSGSLANYDTVDLIDELERRDPEWFKSHKEFKAALADRDQFQARAEDCDERIRAAIRALGVRPIDEVAAEIEDKRWAQGLKPARVRELAEETNHEVTPRTLPEETRRPDPSPAPGRRDSSETFPPRWQRILDGVAWAQRLLKRDAVERNIVAWLADISPKSSSYANDLGAMRARGLIDYPGQGLLALANDGTRLANWPEKAPTKQALVDAIKLRLEPRHRRILDVVWRSASPMMTRGFLAQQAGISETSSSFANDLGKLRTLGLLDYPQQGMVGLGQVLR